MVRISRPFSDALASIGALTVLLAVLVAVDPRVRDQVMLRSSGAAVQSQLRDAGVQLRGLGSVVAEVAREQSVEHAPMLVLVVTGCMLTVFLLRS